MATRTVTSRDWFKPYETNLNLTGYAAPEGASQTFKIGTPLIFDTTSSHENRVVTAGSDPTSGILGVASVAASGTTDSEVTYWIANNGNQFMGVVQSSGTLDYTQVGLQCGIVYDSTNTIWRVDYSDTTNKNVEITGLIDADGDVNGRVRFQFISTARIPYQG